MNRKLKEVENDVTLIAFCGLYCAACGSYLKGKCPGCSQNTKATWCKVRSCCLENNYKSCTDCKEFTNVMDCKKYNNFISRTIGFILRSNRSAGIQMIKEKGYNSFAEYMGQNKIQSIKK